jgi:hypothetical protein
MLLTEPQTDYWSLMARQAKVEEEQIHCIQRATHMENVNAVRTALNEQIAEKKRAKEAERRRAVELRKEQEAEKERWNEELRKKAEEHRVEASKVKLDREEQVRQLEQRRELQRQQQLRDDEEMRRVSEKQAAEALLQAEADKDRQQAVMHTLLAANKAQREEVEQRKQKDRDLDRYYDEQAAIKAEKDDRARALALQQLLDKMKASDAIAAVNLGVEQERAAQEEERIRQYAAARIAREDQARAADDAKHAAVLEKVKQVQAVQRQAKLIQEADREAQKNAEKEWLEKVIEEEREAAAATKQKERAKKFKQRGILQEQLREKEQYQQVIVSDIERTINKPRIDKAMFLQNSGVLSAEMVRRVTPF